MRKKQLDSLHHVKHSARRGLCTALCAMDMTYKLQPFLLVQRLVVLQIEEAVAHDAGQWGAQVVGDGTNEAFVDFFRCCFLWHICPAIHRTQPFRASTGNTASGW